MEQIVNWIVCFLLISTFVRAYSFPAPSGVISGQEFLSLLMESEDRSDIDRSRSSIANSVSSRPLGTTAHPYRGSRKFSHFYDDRAVDEDSVLPIEALFTSKGDPSRSGSSSNISRNRYSPRSGKVQTSTTTTRTTTTATPEVVEEFEDLEVAASEISVGSSFESTDGGYQQSSLVTSAISEEAMDTTADSVPITSTASTITTSTSQQPTLKLLQKNISSSRISKAYVSEDGSVPDSNSYRSEFMIDENSPAVAAKDAHGESSNIHHVVASPDDRTVLRGRMQRKQDSMTPLQTVIYHDKQDDKDQGRSVSYSFIGETAPTLKTWKDIDEEYLPRKNQSKGTIAESMLSSTTTPVMLEPAKMWAEPEKNYSEPAKVWSEPAKIYSEPAKIYSEPARIYSEPARIYSEPAKIYSRPSSYWQTLYDNPNSRGISKPPSTTTSPEPPDETKRVVFNELDKIPYDELNAPAESDDSGSIHNAIGKFIPKQVHEPQKKPHPHKPTPDPTEIIDPYVEKQGVGNGNPTAVVQTLAPAAGSADDSKVGYVVEGRNYRKYRVEEKTPDGFIVGEYGVLSHNDGNLRGVRYTADSDINPRLIYDALLKFLSL